MNKQHTVPTPAALVTKKVELKQASASIPIPASTEDQEPKKSRNQRRKEARKRAKELERLNERSRQVTKAQEVLNEVFRVNWERVPTEERNRILGIQHILSTIEVFLLSGRVTGIYLETAPEDKELDVSELPAIIEVSEAQIEEQAPTEPPKDLPAPVDQDVLEKEAIAICKERERVYKEEQLSLNPDFGTEREVTKSWNPNSTVVQDLVFYTEPV